MAKVYARGSKAEGIKVLQENRIKIPPTRIVGKTKLNKELLADFMESNNIQRAILRSSFSQEDSKKNLAGVFPSVGGVTRSNKKVKLAEFEKECTKIQKKTRYKNYDIVVQEHIKCSESGILQMHPGSNNAVLIKNRGNLDNLIKGLKKKKGYSEEVISLEQLRDYNKGLYKQVMKISKLIKHPSIIEWGISKNKPFIFQVRRAPKNEIIEMADRQIIPPVLDFQGIVSSFEKFILSKVYNPKGSPFIKALGRVMSNKSMEQIRKAKTFNQIFLNKYTLSTPKLVVFFLKLNTLKSNMLEISKRNLGLLKVKNLSFNENLRIILGVSYYSTLNNIFLGVTPHLKRKREKPQKSLSLPLEYFKIDKNVLKVFNKEKEGLYKGLNKKIISLKRLSDNEKFFLESKTVLRDLLNIALIRFKIRFGKDPRVTKSKPSLKFEAGKRIKAKERILGFANFSASIKGVIGKDVLLMKRFDYGCFPFAKNIKAVIVEKSHCLSHPYVLCKSHKILFLYNVSNFNKLKSGDYVEISPLNREIVEIMLVKH